MASTSDPTAPETVTANEGSPAAMVSGLTKLLTVERLDTDLYRGARDPGGRGRVFGGQVIAQALKSASLSVDTERSVHSLHAYFMRPGDDAKPIIYQVERDFDGGSFSTRRVIARQDGRPIFNMATSFHRPEPGASHQAEMPDVAAPEDLPTETELAERHRDTLPEPYRTFLTRPRPIEFRCAHPAFEWPPQKREAVQHIWVRAVAPLGDDPLLHRAVLAYTSDYSLLGTALLPHGLTWISPNVIGASLDHAMWFHDDVRADDWLLYSTYSPWAGGARGFNRGRLFARDGRLVASTAQEGLIRQKQPREDG